MLKELLTNEILRRLTMVIAALIVAMPARVNAQQPSATIDPVTASPDMYEVLLENEHVRVVRYEIAPSEKDQWHTHPSKVSYIVSGGTLRITTASGDSFDVEEQSDSATWLDAIGTHYAENVGKSAVRIVLVEVKSADKK